MSLMYENRAAVILYKTCFQMIQWLIFQKEIREIFFIPSSKRCHDACSYEQCIWPWSNWKLIPSASTQVYLTQVLSTTTTCSRNSLVFSTIKQTWREREPSMQSVQRWTDLIFLPSSDFHSNTMSSLLSILHETPALQRWARISLWEIHNMNPITSDKASSRKSSHPKKLITDTSKNTGLQLFLTLK